jgi:TatD DNase family protein
MIRRRKVIQFTHPGNQHEINLKTVDLKTNEEAIEISNTYPFIYSTVGFHPSEIDKIKEDDYLKLENQLKNTKVVAIGEIGLDYYWNKNNKEQQIEMFKKQLDIASEYNKPVIIHSREATEDVLEILHSYKLKGIIHAFSGSIETARQFIMLGYKLGIGGVLTFKNSKLYEVIKDIDLEYIVLETDSPYLTPEPYRGSRNKPTYVSLVAKKISEIKNVSYEDVCSITYNNTVSLFDLNQ